MSVDRRRGRLAARGVCASLFALLLALPIGAVATPAVRWSIGGEWKTILELRNDYGPAPDPGGVLALSYDIARLMGHVSVWDRVSAEAHLTVAFATWNFDDQRIRLYGTGVYPGVPELLPLQAAIAPSGNPDRWEARFRTDRLWIRARSRWVDLVIGRQPVTFRTALLFPSMDRVIVPLPFTARDTEYKVGIDAVRADLHLGTASELSLIYAFGNDLNVAQARTAAVLRTPVGRGDALLLAGVRRAIPQVSVGYDVDVAPFTVRGEANLVFTADALGAAPAYAAATLAAQYRAPFGLSTLIEVHYFGFGVDHPADYNRVYEHPLVLSGDVPALLGKWHAGVLMSYPLSPRLRAQLLSLVSLQDWSAVVSPALFVVAGGVELRAEVRIPLGTRWQTPWVLNSEYSPWALDYIIEARAYL